MASAPTNLADLTARGVVSGALAGVTARERTLPLLPAFAEVLAQAAVQRGSVLACSGTASVSLALALAAGPSAEGAWVAVAGLPSLGLAAAAELGVALDRLVAVVEPVGAEGAPEPFDDGLWGDALAALIDGFDVVVLGPGTQRVRPGTARRLLARLQARGAVAITIGAPVFGADLQLAATHTAWAGLGQGHGVARARMVRVEASGRRLARARHAHLWLPGPDGTVQVVVADPAGTSTASTSTASTSTASTSTAGTALPLRQTG